MHNSLATKVKLQRISYCLLIVLWVFNYEKSPFYLNIWKTIINTFKKHQFNIFSRKKYLKNTLKNKKNTILNRKLDHKNDHEHNTCLHDATLGSTFPPSIDAMKICILGSLKKTALISQVPP